MRRHKKLTRLCVKSETIMRMIDPATVNRLVRGAGDETGVCTVGGHSLCAAQGCSALAVDGCVAAR